MKPMRILATLLVTIACVLPAFAQSDETAKRFHVLPLIADGSGWQSFVLVTNVAQSASLCTVELHGLSVDRFRDVSGVTATGSTATFELAGRGGNLVWGTRNESGLASGYATLDCVAPVVAQVVLASIDESGATTGMATVFSSQAGAVFQFPVLTADATVGFAIANDTNVDAACGLVLEDPQRVTLGEMALSAPSKSNVARMLNAAIAIPETFNGGSATVSCDRRVAMIGVHFELQPDRAITTFNTLPLALLDTFPYPSDETAKRFHVLPHVADGSGWQSRLLVTNAGRATSQCTVELHGLTVDRFEDAGGVTAAGSTATFELGGAGGYLVWGTQNAQPLASGYATLDCTAPVVAQVVFASIDESGAPTGMATVFSAQAGAVFQFPVLTPAATLGFAIANDTNADAECRIVLEDPARMNLGEAAVSVPPKSSLEQMLNTAVAIPEGFLGGTARVGCDQQVAVTGIHMELAPNGDIITFNTLPSAVLDSSSSVEASQPTVTLSVSAASIELGQATTLTWSSTNAASATITPDIGEVALSGWREVSPSVTTTYRIAVTTTEGQTATASVTVSVNVSERAVLTAFFEATGGENWRNNTNWLTDRPLSEWRGVGVDAGGRVTSLKLGANYVTGPIPPGLGRLTHLTELDLRFNRLTGSIPPELGALTNLRELVLDNNYLTGAIPPELGRLIHLTVLDLSGGPGGLLGVPGQLTGSIPPELGALTQLSTLSLRFNKLTGSIPPELGALANVEWLYLQHNRLTGSIPPELGALANLSTLELNSNDLTGPIPPELGALVAMDTLDLRENNLTGSIPPELGRLSSLWYLYLNGNDLTGSIPSELGRLSSLWYLYLNDNDLTGPLPPELGRLINLRKMHFRDNDLTGSLPPEMAELTNLKTLILSHNTRMSGALPVDLTRLGQIDELLAADTGLCAPSDAGFRDWLVGIQRQRLASCDPPTAYLTQAVQSRRFPVSLVAGEEALLRVFVTAPDAGGETVPPVRARFYVDGQEVYVAEIPGGSASISAQVEEGSLAGSANARVPADIVQPGLEFVVEVDPAGTLGSGLGLARRIPETGRLPVDVRAMPVFDLTVIPFVQNSNSDTSIVEMVEAMATDPQGHELLWDTRTLLPIGDLEVTAHESVLVDTDNAHRLLAETTMIHAMEGAGGHYMGTMTGRVTGGAAGVANLGGKTSFVTTDSFVIAHELGHNMGLLHAPCRADTYLDSVFPRADGSIGAWGYDFRDGGRLLSQATPDLMSFCRRPHWISDYHFTNALGYRWSGAVSARSATTFKVGTPRSVATARSLLLWGGVDGVGAPFLEPAFVVEAPASLPLSTGDYRIIGRTANGEELFSLAFEMPEVSDGTGGSSFAFTLPIEPGWSEELAGVTLSGPGGAVTLDEDTNRPVTILRNPATGQVRGVLRDRPEAAAAPALAPGVAAFAEIEALTSRGLPDPEDWR